MSTQTTPQARYSRLELFGPIVPGRECGDCTACCTFTSIDTPEIVKPMGSTCQHCSANGCTIYEQRFSVCREWQCIWKHVSEMPEQSSPDKLGLMFVLDHKANPDNILTRVCIRILIIDQEKATNHPLAEPLIDMFCRGDLPVWLDDLGGELTLLHPELEVARCLLKKPPTDVSEFDSSIIEQAKAWSSGVRVE